MVSEILAILLVQDFHRRNLHQVQMMIPEHLVLQSLHLLFAQVVHMMKMVAVKLLEPQIHLNRSHQLHRRSLHQTGSHFQSPHQHHPDSGVHMTMKAFQRHQVARSLHFHHYRPHHQIQSHPVDLVPHKTTKGAVTARRGEMCGSYIAGWHMEW
uniref:Uncharacterized protein n=1 Tax=Lutzomyia longipalpis TaxID=7200 RepID=A0A1B0CMN1_LUTLO